MACICYMLIIMISMTVELLRPNKPTAILKGKTFNEYTNADLRDHRPGWDQPSPSCEGNSCQPQRPEQGAQNLSALSHDTSWHPHLEYKQTTSTSVNRKHAKIEARLFTMTCMTVSWLVNEWQCHRPLKCFLLYLLYYYYYHIMTDFTVMWFGTL